MTKAHLLYTVYTMAADDLATQAAEQRHGIEFWRTVRNILGLIPEEFCRYLSWQHLNVQSN